MTDLTDHEVVWYGGSTNINVDVKRRKRNSANPASWNLDEMPKYGNAPDALSVAASRAVDLSLPPPVLLLWQAVP